MRATCENCGQRQPPDWKPGDLCIDCGHVVQREKRCHWCVKLTPDGKFCRHCGAGQVPDAQYGAARWLKHLHADQFAIPDRLAAMDPEQVAHFTRLYQRQAIVVERLVEDLAYTESFARQRGWARQWEETLLPLLPLKNEEIAALSMPPLRGTTDLEKLLEIRQQSPLPICQLLSALARIRIWQTSDLDYAALDLGADFNFALPYLKDPDLAVRLEVAMTLSHWRFVITRFMFGQSEIESILREGIRTPLVLEASTNLALLNAHSQGTPQEVYAEALASENPEIAFTAALANYNTEPLMAALRVPRRQFAAALMLTKAGVDFGLAAIIPSFSANELEELVQVLEFQKRPRPDLRAYFMAVLAGKVSIPTYALEKIQELLTLDLQPGDAARLLREKPERSFGAKLLKSPALTPPELADLCREYVALDMFTTDNLPGYGYPALPPGFVAENWRTAPQKSLQGGLRGLAQQQLTTGARSEVQALHKFLRGVLWEDATPLEARRQADSVLINWYEGYHQSPYLPLAFTEAASRFYFGSFEAYVQYFVDGVKRLDTLIAFETESKFLRPLQHVAQPDQPADAAAFMEAMAALPLPLVVQFRAALVDVALHYTNWGMVNEWAVQILARLYAHAPWREAVRADLESLKAAPSENARYQVTKALSG